MTKAQRAKAIEEAARELMDAINRFPMDTWAASFAASNMAVALAEPVTRTPRTNRRHPCAEVKP